MGLDAIIFIFWTLSFEPDFSLSNFTFIKRFFSSSSFSSIRVVSSASLRLLIFLPATLIPACASSSLSFHKIHSAYKLNKQGDNIQPWCTPFPIRNQSIAPCFPCDSAGKESTCNVGDLGLIPGLGMSPGEGKGYPLQYSDLENSMDCSQRVRHDWVTFTLRASLIAQLVKNPPAVRETWVWSWVGKIPWRRERLPTPVF